MAIYAIVPGLKQRFSLIFQPAITLQVTADKIRQKYQLLWSSLRLNAIKLGRIAPLARPIRSK